MSTQARATVTTDTPAVAVQAVQRACACGKAAGGTGKCPFCAAEERLGVQPKLRINPPGDRWEQEADRVADHVVADRPAKLTGPLSITPLVQRQPIEEEEEELQAKREIQRQPIEEEEEELQAKESRRGQAGGVAPTNFVNELASEESAGQPLDRETQGYFERRLGTDLSDVRVHRNGRASALASQIGARAFTAGQHLYFAPAQYHPSTKAGRRLIAHEIVHSLQQRGGSPAAARTPPAGAVQPVIQRDLALQPTNPDDELVELTAAQVRDAIAFNNRHYDSDSIRIIQDVVGTEQTGTADETTVRLVGRLQRDFGEDQDGKVGEDTFAVISRIREAEGADTGHGDCITEFDINFVHGPEPTLHGGLVDVLAHFRMHARFEPRCDCSQFEYRQFICGSVELVPPGGGAPIQLRGDFPIPGGAGIPACPDFTEDGDTNLPAGTGPHYGHRDEGGANNDRYSPDRATGCEYDGFDLPGRAGISLARFRGFTLRMRLSFRGQVMQRADERVRRVAVRWWNVNGDVVL